MTTIWGDDERYVDTYYKSFADEMVYTTFDWATRDDDGYYFVLGRTDDVINVAGHRWARARSRKRCRRIRTWPRSRWSGVPTR
jgi:acyl-coenzyme A synthetase/AMP-(fatty) acid ligase